MVRAHLFHRTILFISFIALILSFAADSTAADGDQPAFFPGERLKFKLKWGFIPAGEAELEVMPIETINGVKTYHFVMKARTNSFIDKIYKYRSRIDAYADLEMTHSLLYLKKTQERKSTKEVRVQFDWEKNEAHYRRVKIRPGRTPKISNRDQRTALLPGSFDPLSIFYYTRLTQLGNNSLIEYPVTDGKKCVVARADIVKRVNIKVHGKNYDTFLVQPDLKHLEGVFNKSKNAKIHLWVTADRRRLPVRMKSRVFVGSFTGELVSIESPVNVASSKARPLEKNTSSAGGF